MSQQDPQSRQKVVILGAAGRDFHNFNTVFRNNPAYEVVAFTATQIPNIDGRAYPAELAGEGYPAGVPIESENDLEEVIRRTGATLAVFSYSDVTYEHVMRTGIRAMQAGADYMLLGPERTMLPSTKPVVAICASRTGAGKSQTSRKAVGILRDMGLRAVAVRHPMPYGNLARQAVQRFATMDDMELHEVTIEEREEYEPHVAAGGVIYAGVDYERILREAEQEADVIIWDGGNNDLPFFRPDLLITVVDTLRADHALHYYPGELNVRMAQVIVLNKIDSASLEQIETARRTSHALNPGAIVIDAASPITVEEGAQLRGKRVLVIEDGPTLTHGEMAYGAGWVAAQRMGAAEIIDPRPYAVGALAETFAKYPNTGPILPAMGYGAQQVADLSATIRATPADVIVIATPIDLRRLIAFDRPALRVGYDLQEIGSPTLESVLADWVATFSS
jgi:predicted GTPase